MLFFKNHEIRGVIFDMDGTLLDSLTLYYILLKEAFEENGLTPVSRDTLFGYLGEGVSLKDILRQVIPEDRGDDVIDAVAKEVLHRFVKVDMEIPLLPGVERVFDFLKSNDIKMGLATGRTSEADYEWDRLIKRGLDHFVEAVVTASDVKNRKPAPDLIMECARNMDVPVEACLAVGDSISDILAARASGAIPVAVSTGIADSEQLKKQNPEAVLKELDELIGLFKKTRKNDIHPPALPASFSKR